MDSSILVKKKVCLVCVCYNAYDDALRLLNSIEASYQLVESLDLTVVLSDNSTDTSDLSSISEVKFSFDYKYIKNENIGYFPAFYQGLEASNSDFNQFDYIIVSNVDLQIDASFLNTLIDYNCPDKIGVIAPQILTTACKIDLNPKISSRPSKFKLEFLKFLFGHYKLFQLYNFLSTYKYNKQKKQLGAPTPIASTTMYAAHGSFIIFTRNYCKQQASLCFPRFLFCEELFVAEELIGAGLKVQHVKKLIIHDNEHGSTSQIHSKFIANEHVKSISYILSKYY